LRQTLHPRIGDKPSLDVIRLFVVGARAESTLPPSVWDQLRYNFPGVAFHIYMIGPEVTLPTAAPSSLGSRTRKANYGVPAASIVVSECVTITTIQAPYEAVHAQMEPFDPYTDVFFAFSPGFGFPSQLAAQEAQRARAEDSADAKRMAAARETYNARSGEEPEPKAAQQPFMAAPGTPAPAGGEVPSAEPAPAIPSDAGFTSIVSAPVVQAQAEWATAIGQILSTKCPLVVTGFSPADVERDVLAFESLEGVMGEFEWLVTPGENVFASQQWAVGELLLLCAICPAR
jgi:splicing suppressor protein 51